MNVISLRQHGSRTTSSSYDNTPNPWSRNTTPGHRKDGRGRSADRGSRSDRTVTIEPAVTAQREENAGETTVQQEDQVTGSTTGSQVRMWGAHELPGGRKLWSRLVFGFALLAAVGAVFITLGAVYVKQAFQYSHTNGLTIPFVLCIVSMVTGVLMLGGSFVLGKLLISDKWRKNQQPTYRSQAVPTVRYHRSGTDGNCPGTETVVISQLRPPSYEASANDSTVPPPNVFVISGQEININMSPTHNQSPPEYTDSLDLPPPPYTDYLPNDSPGGDTETESQPVHSPGGTAVPDAIAGAGDLNDGQSGCVNEPNSTVVNMTQIYQVLSGRRSVPSQLSLSSSSRSSSTDDEALCVITAPQGMTIVTNTNTDSNVSVMTDRVITPDG